MPLISFAKVSKNYRTGKIVFPALKEVDLEVNQGEFLALAGPSGSGKTTILNIIGLLDKPSSGKYSFAGEDSAARSDNTLAELRRDLIGFVFQTFNLIPVLTAFENVEFPLLMQGGMTAAERRNKVEALLREVGLGEFMQRRPAEMSGGQQQRVAVARALVKQPSLVLADEPTANLDSRNGREILELMKAMNEKTGATFLFSTHDRMVMDLAGRLIQLRDGRIHSDETRSLPC